MPHKAHSKAQARLFFWKFGEKKGHEMVAGQNVKALPERVEGGKKQGGKSEKLRTAAQAALREARKKSKKA